MCNKFLIAFLIYYDRITRELSPYFTVIPGLVTILTSNRLKKEMISKIKKATKKNNRSNKQTRNTDA